MDAAFVCLCAAALGCAFFIGFAVSERSVRKELNALDMQIQKLERFAATSKVEQLKSRIINMIEAGCVGFHFSVGPKWHRMSIEEKAAATLEMWDAPSRRVTAEEIDGPDDGPPRCRRTPQSVADFVRELGS